ALLFLGAGSVIHAMHHEQDMRYYGALRKEIPLTFWAMMAGTLAITGVGIINVFGFAGFYSKDAILEAAYASGGGGIGAFYVGAFAALLTSFYSWRLIFLTFFGKARWAASEHIQHAIHGQHEDPEDEAPAHEHDDHAVPSGTGGYHPHESPWSMLISLGVLTLGAVFSGFIFHLPFVDAEHGMEFWKGSIAFKEHLMHAMHGVPMWVKLAPGGVMLIGLYIAFMAYMRPLAWPERFTSQFALLYQFLLNKWYFDELYNVLFVKPAFAIGRFLWKAGDEGTIDRFGPNGLAAAVVLGGKYTRKLQSGYLYTYALVMLIGLSAAVTWAMVR
ncbi:MAG: NADH-quinone oxidoreductase subunit L, partial [Alphaproteobacteria bacterium]|nr:NADH-quinone oxidoreductase subunit L [Alphaproteobacteria bacterium]